MRAGAAPSETIANMTTRIVTEAAKAVDKDGHLAAQPHGRRRIRRERPGNARQFCPLYRATPG